VVEAHLAIELFFGEHEIPCFVHTIDHPDGLVLVDTGMIDSTPELDAEWRFILHPLPDELVQRVAHVVITHAHFDHIGGNRLFPGVPIHIQRVELEDARTMDDYTIREWVDFPGMNYVEHDGEAEILPGVRLVPAPGETRGHQIVVVETGDGTVVLGGDVGHFYSELKEADTPGKQLVHELRAPVYLAHEREPWLPESLRSG
jgi:N-acyl homoserine lactone hydrolase